MYYQVICVMQISNYSTMANIGNIIALHNLYMANIYKSISKIEKKFNAKSADSCSKVHLLMLTLKLCIF